MELYDGIISRRRSRNYTGERIDEEIIKSLIRAVMYAPSARNKRPWHFVVIDDRSVLKHIMKVHPYSSMLASASHAIVVCSDKNLENGPGYYKFDCAAPSENILLAAHSKGLGAVWLGVEPREKRINAVSNILGLPPDIVPVSIISIGVPAKITSSLPDRFEEQKIRKNKW